MNQINDSLVHMEENEEMCVVIIKRVEELLLQKGVFR